MSPRDMGARRPRRERERGQGLVEFALAVPVIILIVLSVAELGLAFGNTHTLGYASREGARVGSALARGEDSLCVGSATDPSSVDATLVSAVQRIMLAPGSGIDMSNVEEVRIFKAKSTGEQDGDFYNIWKHYGPGAGPDVDPGTGTELIEFRLEGPLRWAPCHRDNSATSPDSIGVTVTYKYDFLNPMADMVEAIAGGSLSITLSETTVMSLNPSV